MRTSFSRLISIGDPHLLQVPFGLRMGRRIEQNFTEVALDKLRQAVKLAKDLDALPLVLGDMFHRADECSLSLLNQVIQILKEEGIVLFDVGGNHSLRGGIEPSEDEALRLLLNAGVVQLLSPISADPFIVEIAGQPVRLASVPYGIDFPSEVASAGKGVPTVLASHHDLAFESAYPGALPLREIKGVDLIINGHMHRTMKPVQCGQTRWENPGNILRLSIDCKDHKPAVWSWAPGEEGMTPHYLVAQADVFDLSGVGGAGHDSAASVAALDEHSEFASLLAASAPETVEGEDIKKLVMDVAEAAEASDGVKALLTKLLAGDQEDLAGQL